MNCENLKNEKITLLPNPNLAKHSSFVLDSIVVCYNTLDNKTNKTKRTFYYKSYPSVVVEYDIISQDSIIFMQLPNFNEKSNYLIFDKTKMSNIVFPYASEYFTGGLRYLGKEIYWNEKINSIDSLSIFYGKDIGFDHWPDSLYFLFDNSLCLRKILLNDSNVMFIDKKLLNVNSSQ